MGSEMRKIFLLVLGLSLLIPKISQAQVTNDEPLFGIKFKGFVMANIAYDTRQTVNAREGDLALFPQPVALDADGNDIFEVPSFNILSVFSRLSGSITGPNAFGAKTSGVLEGDFFGQTNGDVNGFRLRHAIIKLNWNKTTLMVGQYWSPLFVLGVTPGVVAVSAGAPFQPFSRNPQIRIEHEANGIKLIAAALTQRDFKSPGPVTGTDYLRNSGTPDLHLQFQFPGRFAMFGIGGEIKSLLPELITSNGYKADEKITTYTGIAYMKASKGMVSFKAEGVYGSNMTDHLMLGGYAVSGIDTVTGRCTYTGVNAISGWADLSVGKAVQGGIFFGYTENQGADDPIVGAFYGRGFNILSVSRLAPRIQVRYGQSRFALETEFTSAYYGIPDQNGIVKNTEKVSNTRFLFASYYYF